MLFRSVGRSDAGQVPRGPRLFQLDSATCNVYVPQLQHEAVYAESINVLRDMCTGMIRDNICFNTRVLTCACDPFECIDRPVFAEASFLPSKQSLKPSVQYGGFFLL